MIVHDSHTWRWQKVHDTQSLAQVWFVTRVIVHDSQTWRWQQVHDTLSLAQVWLVTRVIVHDSQTWRWQQVHDTLSLAQLWLVTPSEHVISTGKKYQHYISTDANWLIIT